MSSSLSTQLSLWGLGNPCSGDILRRANGFALQQVASSVVLRALRSLVSDKAEDRLG